MRHIKKTVSESFVLKRVLIGIWLTVASDHSFNFGERHWAGQDRTSQDKTKESPNNLRL